MMSTTAIETTVIRNGLLSGCQAEATAAVPAEICTATVTT